MPEPIQQHQPRFFQPTRISVWLSPLLLIATFAGIVTAEQPRHPNHISLAEVEFNARTGNFEVALCVWPTDLEQVLCRQQGRLIDLQKEPSEQLDKMMARYIDAKFRIRLKGEKATLGNTSPTQSKPPTANPLGNVSTIESNSTQGSVAVHGQQDLSIRWVGHQASLKQVWVFFEVPGASGKRDWTIENRVFFELNDDQLNQIQWNSGTEITTLVCERNDPRHPITTGVSSAPSPADRLNNR